MSPAKIAASLRSMRSSAIEMPSGNILKCRGYVRRQQCPLCVTFDQGQGACLSTGVCLTPEADIQPPLAFTNSRTGGGAVHSIRSAHFSPFQRVHFTGNGRHYL